MTGRAEAVESSELRRFGSDHHAVHAGEQAQRGLKNFHQVKSAMSTPGHETMKHYDGAAGAPTFVNHDGVINEKSRSEHNGQIKAPETNDPISRDPIQSYRQREQNSRTPMDEHGKHQDAGYKPNNQYQASSHVENGKVQSATVSGRDGSITYTLDKQGKPTLRTDASQEGTYVTTYGKDGHVASLTYKDSKPGSADQPVPFDKHDRADAKTKDGKTTITTKDGKTKESVTLDNQGNVESSSHDTPAHSYHTEYNRDGSMKSNSDVERDSAGKVATEEHQTPRSDDKKEYDTNDQVVKEVHTDAVTGNTYKKEILPNGTRMQQKVGPDGDHTVVESPDGTRFEHSSTDKFQSSKITNPDGSSVQTTNDSYASAYIKTDKNGNWERYQFNKGSGSRIRSSGGPNSEVDISTLDSQHSI